ncbi:hypothetical protein WKW77_30635 [Variovorax ureilyticus]|uniref:Uncharacterized protein n=1 Tax=Variovorax ureilyticus TaxID=1836198 RepID=A0ABU8VPN1_9BURK
MTIYFTVTKLGRRMTPPRRARELNQMLEAAGMQVHDFDRWSLTPLGKRFARVAVKQIGLIKWKEDVVPHLDNPNTQAG